MKVFITSAVISGLLFIIDSRNFVGRTINQYIPCEQNPMNSFPCFGIYDIYFSIFMIVIFIASVIGIGWGIYKWIKKHNIT